MEPKADVVAEAPASQVPCPYQFDIKEWTSKANNKSLWLVLSKNGTEVMRLKRADVAELGPILTNKLYGEKALELLRKASIALVASGGNAKAAEKVVATIT